MIKTPLSTVIGGAGIWTPGCTVISGQQTITQLIKSLFSDGTQGLYLNAQDATSIADLSNIKDLSGNNNHAVQPNATSRATLITDPSGYKSLKFDGIDDSYVTQSIDFTGTDKVTVIAAVRKFSDANAGVVAELSNNVNVNNNSFIVHAPGGTESANRFTIRVRNTTDTATAYSIGDLKAPISVVQTGLIDKSINLLTMRINSVSQNRTSVPLNADKFGNYPLYIGRRGGTSLPLNGQIYALLVIGKLLDDATTAKIEKEFAKYIGVTL